MSFLNPLYLWSLLGLLIPIAIHLWSKKEGKTIKIGSIKFLDEQDSKQSSSINLNELLLLFLRVLIITTVVLILAQPRITRKITNTPITYLVEASLLENPSASKLLDSLRTIHDVRLLKQGFPELSKDKGEYFSKSTPDYWQLARDMEELHTDSIIVLTSASQKGLKGKRPTISIPVDWIPFPDESIEEQIIEASLTGNRISMLSTNATPKHITFRKEKALLSSDNITLNDTKDSITINQKNKTSKLAVTQRDSLKVLIYYDKKLSNEATYIKAGLNALSQYFEIPIQINQTQDSANLNTTNYNRIVWLNKTAAPKTQVRSLIYKEDIYAKRLIVEGNDSNSFYLTMPLNLETALDSRLTEALLSWLHLHPDLKTKLQTIDKRVISKAELLPVYKNDDDRKNTFLETWGMTNWLWIILGMLLIIERMTARTRKQ